MFDIILILALQRDEKKPAQKKKPSKKKPVTKKQVIKIVNQPPAQPEKKDSEVDFFKKMLLSKLK